MGLYSKPRVYGGGSIGLGSAPPNFGKPDKEPDASETFLVISSPKKPEFYASGLKSSLLSESSAELPSASSTRFIQACFGAAWTYDLLRGSTMVI